MPRTCQASALPLPQPRPSQHLSQNSACWELRSRVGACSGGTLWLDVERGLAITLVCRRRLWLVLGPLTREVFPVHHAQAVSAPGLQGDLRCPSAVLSSRPDAGHVPVFLGFLEGAVSEALSRPGVCFLALPRRASVLPSVVLGPVGRASVAPLSASATTRPPGVCPLRPPIPSPWTSVC